MRQLWVDFNEIDRSGHLTSLLEFAEDDETLTVGQSIVVGDDDGTLCTAVITDMGSDGIVSLALDLGTFHQDTAQVAIAV